MSQVGGLSPPGRLWSKGLFVIWQKIYTVCKHARGSCTSVQSPQLFAFHFFDKSSPWSTFFFSKSAPLLV